MGNAHGDQALVLLADQESEIECGQKCITGAFMDFDSEEKPVTIEELLDECEIFFRYPVLPGSEGEAMLKTVELEEHGLRNFTVKMIFDGKMLDLAGKGRGDGANRVATWCHFVMATVVLPGPSGPRAHRSVTFSHYVEPVVGVWEDEASDSEVIRQATWHALTGPQCMEIHVRGQSGEIDASEAGVAFLRPFMQELQRNIIIARSARVQVVAHAKSMSEPGMLGNMSDPLVALLEYEQLFPAMLAVLQDTLGREKLDNVTKAGFSGESHRPEVHKGRIRVEVYASEEAGEITVMEIALAEDGSVARPLWSRDTRYVVHRPLLEVESWQLVEDGERFCNMVMARHLQMFLNEVLEKAHSIVHHLGLG